MAKRRSITIKDLHARTGELVRQAGRGRTPLPVTDRGKVVAALVPHTMVPARQRRRSILPDYAAFLARGRPGDVLRDLDAVRGDR